MIGPRLSSGEFFAYRCRVHRACHRVGRVAEIVEAPSIELVGPRMRDDRFFSRVCDDEARLNARQWFLIERQLRLERALRGEGRGTARTLMAVAAAVGALA